MNATTAKYRLTRRVLAMVSIAALAGCIAPAPQFTRTTTTEQFTLEQPAPVVSSTTTTIQRSQTP